MSDLDHDGDLDFAEFVIITHILFTCRNGVPLPQQLPPSLIPPSKANLFNSSVSIPVPASTPIQPDHEEDDEEDTYRIVTTVREDVLNGIISNISPMGKALLGHKVGDRVEVVPGKGDPFHIVIREIVKTTDESQDHIR